MLPPVLLVVASATCALTFAVTTTRLVPVRLKPLAWSWAVSVSLLFAVLAVDLQSDAHRLEEWRMELDHFGRLLRNAPESMSVSKIEDAGIDYTGSPRQRTFRSRHGGNWTGTQLYGYAFRESILPGVYGITPPEGVEDACRPSDRVCVVAFAEFLPGDFDVWRIGSGGRTLLKEPSVAAAIWLNGFWALLTIGLVHVAVAFAVRNRSRASALAQKRP